MTRAFFLLTALAAIASAQPNPTAPDCLISFRLTATGQASNAFNNRQGGCTTWAVTYTSVTFTTGSVTLQSAPNTSTGVAGTFVQFPATNIAVGTNPSLITATPSSGALTIIGYQPWVRVLLTIIGGPASGIVEGVLAGWKDPLNQLLTGVGTDVHFSDNGQLDAFSRLRTSTPTNLFDAQFQYTLQPLIWESVLTATGTATLLPAQSSVRLRVAASGDKVVRQTHQYLRYQPGKSQLITMTGVLGAIKANTRQRMGYFDANNGLFFEQDGTSLRVVQRSSVSGSPVDTAVNQADWNLDKLDGTGPSGVTLDTSKANIFFVDLQWLGVGRVRLGVVVAGTDVYCHQFLNANSQTAVYMATANLPVRYELEMTGATTTTDLIQICQSVVSEGGFENERGYAFSASNGVTAIAVTTRRPILSIRPKTTLGGVTNRGLIQPVTADVVTGSGNVLVEVVYNGTLTGASFASVDGNSLTERDVAATAIAGGTVIASFYSVSGAGAVKVAAQTNLLNRIATLALDAGGTVPDILSIVCTAFTGSVDTNAVMNWKEIY